MKRILLDSVDSTNNYAKSISKETLENVLIIANNQTAGRGTKGSTWYSEANSNILMSFLIKNIKNKSTLKDITIKIGKIVYEVLNNNFNLDFEIKLPNDIMCNNKKICGILCERSMANEKTNYLVIGIGINVNQITFNDEIKNIATSLKKELGYDINKNDLISEIEKKVENLIN